MDTPKNLKTIGQIAHDILTPITVVKWFLKATGASEKINAYLGDLTALSQNLKDAARNNDGDVLSNLGEMSEDMHNCLIAVWRFIVGYRPDNQDLAEQRDSALKSSEKINAMINTLRNGHKNLKTICNLSNVIASAVEETLVYAKEKDVRITFKKGEAHVLTDSEAINRVVVNIINNAIEAAGSDTINVRMLTTDSAVRIETLDNGSGIFKHHLTKIFDNGFTHGKIGGSGFGLSFCKEAVEKIGGNLAVHSKKGAGTIFAINLPKGFESASPDDSLWE